MHGFHNFFLATWQLQEVEKSRLALEKQTAEVAATIKEKLETATNHRDERFKAMVDKLKVHVSPSHTPCTQYHRCYIR